MYVLLTKLFCVQLCVCTTLVPFMCSTLVLFMCSTLVLFMCSTLVLFMCSTLVLFMCSTLVLFMCSTLVLFMRSTLVLFMCSTLVLFMCSTLGTCTVCGHPTMSNYFAMYSYKLAFRLSLLLPTISVKYTCTVCGHYHIYTISVSKALAITATSYYKIVGVAVLAFAYRSGYHSTPTI